MGHLGRHCTTGHYDIGGTKIRVMTGIDCSVHSWFSARIAGFVSRGIFIQGFSKVVAQNHYLEETNDHPLVFVDESWRFEFRAASISLQLPSGNQTWRAGKCTIYQ